MSRRSELYPQVEPLQHGYLEVGEGHALYWEICGNAIGKPVVVLHGGPGSGCTKDARRYFDPEAYRIILFDQRNCGRSLPHASEPDIDLRTNTTPRLVQDIEALRSHLGVERWMVFGSSWGSTLGLAYAQAHPDRVSELVLAHVTTSRPREIDWLYHGLRRFFPTEWAAFQAGAAVCSEDANLVDRYRQLLFDGDAGVRVRAAEAWCRWEGAIVSVEPHHRWPERYQDPAFRLAFARIVTHYFSHEAWLDDGILLRNAARLSGKPGILLHGRIDLTSPLETAWQLAQEWPGSELVIVHETGHSNTAGMRSQILEATGRFAGQR